MNLELKQIFLPNKNSENIHVSYENQLEPRTVFDSSNEIKLYEQHKDVVFKMLEREIYDYINDDDVCNDDEDMFPRRCVMTGEWYVGDINFSGDYLSIAARFLGHHPNPPLIDDYLELELLFIYHQERKEFTFDGINSSCI